MWSSARSRSLEKACDIVQIRLVHDVQELAGIGGKAFDVSALTFCVDVSIANEDFPEPLSPVTTTSLFFGMSTSMDFRLCSRAPRT